MLYSNIGFDIRSLLEVSGSLPDSYGADTKTFRGTVTSILDFCKQYEKFDANSADSERDLYILGFESNGVNPNLDFECSVMFPIGNKNDGTFIPATIWKLTYFTLDSKFGSSTDDGYVSFQALYNDSRRMLQAKSCSTPVYSSTDEVVYRFIDDMKKRGIKMTSFKSRWYARMSNLFSNMQIYCAKRESAYEFLYEEELLNLREKLYARTGDINNSTRLHAGMNNVQIKKYNSII